MSSTRKSAQQIADEIVSMNRKNFKNIPVNDFKEFNSPEYIKFRDDNTKLNHIVVDEILQHPSPQMRAEEMKHWMQVAEECYQQYDFAGFVAISTAVNLSFIERLAVTHSFLSPDDKKQLETFRKKNDHEMLAMEMKLSFLTRHPLIPYLAIYKKQLDTTGEAKMLAEADAEEINSDKKFTAKDELKEKFVIMFGKMQKHLSADKILAPDLELKLSAVNFGNGAKELISKLNEYETQFYNNSQLVEPRSDLAIIKKIDSLIHDLSNKNNTLLSIFKKNAPLTHALTSIEQFKNNKLPISDLIVNLETTKNNFQPKEEGELRGNFEELIEAYLHLSKVMTNTKATKLWNTDKVQAAFALLQKGLTAFIPPLVPKIDLQRIEIMNKHISETKVEIAPELNSPPKTRLRS